MTIITGFQRQQRIAPHSRDEISSLVRQCIATILDVAADTVTAESSLLDLGADSFHFVDLVFRLEREFGVTIAKEYAIPDDRNVDAFVTIVAEALASEQGAPPADVP